MRVIEIGGGLGDVFIDIFNSDMYTQLDTLPKNESVQVVLRSANPGISDLFRWHPRSAQMEIIEVGSGDPWGPEQRKKFGVGEPTPRLARNGAPVIFYPSKEDRQLLSNMSKPYIVFAISAGWPSVNIPLPIAEQAADIAIAKKLTVITVGRSYSNVLRNFRDGTESVVPREESRLTSRPGVIDTIDRLSVPGLASLVNGAVGSFCCHSSLLSISWQFRRPVFALYHEMKQREWTEKAGTTWGRDFPETKSVCLNDWKPEVFGEFINLIIK